MRAMRELVFSFFAMVRKGKDGSQYTAFSMTYYGGPLSINYLWPVGMSHVGFMGLAHAVAKSKHVRFPLECTVDERRE